MSTTIQATANTMTPEQIRKHWQGHRALTRRVIDAFPEKELYEYSIGGMRPFAVMAMELALIAAKGANGFLTNDWNEATSESVSARVKDYTPPATKAELLQLWDDITAEIDRVWPQIAPERWLETVNAFGYGEQPMVGAWFYFLDNENHHRGQGYVYLRSLGIEPPPFWERTMI
ncbi:DinB family protein [Chitinophaga rhizosphaerae]|uniref:DinB family protein n=1 Tax=Chitinophaga rhizosphaerae TaxID=1864947 RepID=UPI000F810964|nr:DinB family protein [Chitinophaga rhizosphaerae]